MSESPSTADTALDAEPSVESAGETARAVLELAGIEDIWTRSSGNTRTTVNFAKATFNALRKTAQARVPQQTREKREVIE